MLELARLNHQLGHTGFSGFRRLCTAVLRVVEQCFLWCGTVRRQVAESVAKAVHEASKRRSCPRTIYSMTNSRGSVGLEAQLVHTARAEGKPPVEVTGAAQLAPTMRAS